MNDSCLTDEPAASPGVDSTHRGLAFQPGTFSAPRMRGLGGVAWGLAHVSLAHPPLLLPPGNTHCHREESQRALLRPTRTPGLGRRPAAAARPWMFALRRLLKRRTGHTVRRESPWPGQPCGLRRGPGLPRGWSGHSCRRSAGGHACPPACGALRLSWLQDSAAGGQPHPSEEEGPAGRGQPARPLGLCTAAAASTLTRQGPPASGPRLVRQRVDHHHTRDTPGVDSGSSPEEALGANPEQLTMARASLQVPRAQSCRLAPASAAEAGEGGSCKGADVQDTSCSS